MSARYRRRSTSWRDDVGAAAVSILVGAGAATVTFYLTRLFLSREPLVSESHGGVAVHAPAGDAGRLPVGATPSPSDD